MKLCLSCNQSFESRDWQCIHCSFLPITTNDYLSFAPAFAKENNFFPSEGFDHLAQLEAENFWFRARNNLITWAFQRYLSHAKNFLEIGCGTGFVLENIAKNFPALKLSGSEIYDAGLAHAAQRIPHAELFQMDARHIPFKEEFDVIGAFDMLEHVAEDTVVFKQIHQALKPEGNIIITVPQHEFLWSQVDEYSCHFRRYSSKELKTKLNEAGFTIIKMTSFISLLLPLMFLARFKKKKADVNYNPTSELKIFSPLNKFLYSILYLENLLIRGGINFSAGGSLLVIATKKTST